MTAPTPRATRTLLLAFALASGLLLSACQTTEEAAEEAREAGESAYDATAELAGNIFDDDDYLAAGVNDTEADGNVGGVARFAYDDGNEEVVVQGRITGLTPGLHGFHVHENGDCSMQNGTPAGAAGGHYNPTDDPHGAPDDPEDERHEGDFGNIRANSNGVATFQFSYPRDETRFGDFEDRALMIHAGRDDLRSQPSGAAGARVGCGLIGDAEDVDDSALDGMDMNSDM